MPSLATLLAALAACAASPRQAQQGDKAVDPGRLQRQLDFGVGVRTFEDPDFGSLDEPVVFTLDYCEPMGLGPVRLEGGLHYAWDEADGTSAGQDVRLKSELFELSAGLNYTLALGRLRPFVGVGGALQFLDLRGVDDGNTLFDDDDAAFGGYAKVGLLFKVSPGSHVGVEYRRFEGGDVDFDGTNLDSSYEQLVLVLGTSFE